MWWKSNSKLKSRWISLKSYVRRPQMSTVITAWPSQAATDVFAETKQLNDSSLKLQRLSTDAFCALLHVNELLNI